MTDKKQPEALRIASSLELCWGDSRIDAAAAELRRQHAENETLRTGYDAARLEIESLQSQLHAAKQINAAQFNLLAASIPGSAMRPPHGQAPAQAAPAAVAGTSEAVAYLDIGAGGYLDLGTDLSNEALSRLPKGRHALVIAGTYGIDGYIAAPATQPAPQQKAHHLTQALTDPENQPNQYGVKFGMSGQQMHFKIGNQLFRLAYEPDDQQEFEFMKRMLIHAFSTFTPDVKSAPQPSPAAQEGK